jgi:tRNA dimethylallyltransferase
MRMTTVPSIPSTGDAWFITGATAGGKTAVGIELARRLGGEILSLDSMAVYRGLDVGTAKPTPEQRAAVLHHLVDLVEPGEEYSVARYLADAAHAAADVAARGRVPIFVGGTPLYLKALLRGIFAGPPADWDFRHQCKALAECEGPAALHAWLAEVDPASARRLHAGDQRRVVRALEVWTKTGRPISDWQRQFDQGRPAAACRVFVIDWPREALVERIDRRVEAMFAAGLVSEVRGLLAGGRKFSRTAGQALGYREVMAHLNGEIDLSRTIDLVKTRTRQFAKRQLTWFRSLSECRWFPMICSSSGEPLEPAAAAERISQCERHVCG